MTRILASIFVAIFVLSACTPSNTGRPGDGLSIFNIAKVGESKIQFRTLDAVNALREANGLSAVELSPELIAAAQTHAFDISRQNRPWHFGSDGSSPIDRAVRAGYKGQLLGENLSETYEDDITTLNAWMADSNTRSTILDASATNIGLSWHQEKSGKIWWVMLVGA